MSQVTSLNPENVKLIIHARRLTHMAKETYINVEPQGEGIQVVKGILDTSSVIIDPDSSALITLTLMQEKFDNQFLSDIHRQQKAGILGSVNVLLKYVGGTTLVDSPAGFVQQFAPMSFAAEAQNRQWQIVLAHCTTFNVGGNALV